MASWPGNTPRPFIRQRMQQFGNSGVQKGNSEEKEILVVLHRTGVPGKHENDAGNDDAGDLNEAVEEEIVIQTAHIQKREERKDHERGKRPAAER